MEHFTSVLPFCLYLLPFSFLASAQQPMAQVSFSGGENATSYSFDVYGTPMGQLDLLTDGVGVLEVYPYTPALIKGIWNLAGIRMEAKPDSVSIQDGTQVTLQYEASMSILQKMPFFATMGDDIITNVELNHLIGKDESKDFCNVPITIDTEEISPRLLHVMLPEWGVYVLGLRLNDASFPRCVWAAKPVPLENKGETRLFFTASHLSVSVASVLGSWAVDSSLTVLTSSSNAGMSDVFLMHNGSAIPPPSDAASPVMYSIEVIPQQGLEASLSISYDPLLLSALGLSPTHLRFVYWERSRQSWVDLTSPAIIDQENSILTQKTMHLSVWAVSASPPSGTTQAHRGAQKAAIWVGMIAALLACLCCIFAVLISQRIRKRSRRVDDVAHVQLDETTGEEPR